MSPQKKKTKHLDGHQSKISSFFSKVGVGTSQSLSTDVIKADNTPHSRNGPCQSKDSTPQSSLKRKSKLSLSYKKRTSTVSDSVSDTFSLTGLISSERLSAKNKKEKTTDPDTTTQSPTGQVCKNINEDLHLKMKEENCVADRTRGTKLISPIKNYSEKNRNSLCKSFSLKAVSPIKSPCKETLILENISPRKQSVTQVKEQSISPVKSAVKRKQNDDSRSPDIIPATPPNVQLKNKKSLNSKRRILSSGKMGKKHVEALSEDNFPTKKYQAEESVRHTPKLKMSKELYKCEKVSDSLIVKNNIPSTESPSSVCVLSPIKTEDDDILKNILLQISPKKTHSSLKKLSPCKNNTIDTTVATEFSNIHIKPPRVDPLEHVSSAETSKTPSKCPSPSIRALSPIPHVMKSPLRRSPRKLFTDTLAKSSGVSVDSKIFKRESKPQHTCNSNENQLECDLDSLKTIFYDSNEEDMLFFTNLSDSERQPSNSKSIKPTGKCINGPSRRSPRKAVSDNMRSFNHVVSNSCQPSPKMEVSESHKNDNVDRDLMDLDIIFSNDDYSSLSQLPKTDNCLDLSQAQVCQVTSLEVFKQNKEVILHLKSFDDDNKAVCKVRGCWLSCPVYEGDVISIEARKVDGMWLLDDKGGILVVNPDLLISGTTVVGSLFCARRSVLSSFYRGIDSDSAIMIVGSIVHQILQQVLLEQKYTECEIKLIAKQIISSRSCIQMLYASKMTSAEIMKELDEFVPHIASFMSAYVSVGDFQNPKKKREYLLSAPVSNTLSSKAKEADSSNWNGKITCIRDIEETLWEPRLGIKGMVDVSVDVEDDSGKKKSMPLELKTGKASFSAEHKGQVNLYTMMMSRLGMNVMSGLLLYLREGKMREITLSHHERKDLIRLRNTLSGYLLPRSPVIDQVTGKFVPLDLPDPINFASACQKCPYQTLCSVYLKLQGLPKLAPDHPMISLSSEATNHLSGAHIEYVAHWVGMLQLEDMERLKATKLRYFWRHSPEERERNKQAVVNLQLKGPGVDVGGKYSHEFHRQIHVSGTVSVQDVKTCGLNVGDYVTISTDKRLSVDHGSIVSLSRSSVTVLTNKPLFQKYKEDNFCIDRSESNSVFVFSATNLGCLLDNNNQADILRKIIIDKVKPTFTTSLNHSIIKGCARIFKRLNKKQRDAVLKTMQADSYLLIKGLPGTGKTATLVAIVEVLVHAGLSVLITSHTHAAVDNLLLRLKDVGLKFLRLGSDSRIHPELHAYSERALTMDCKSPEDLDEVLSKQRIVGVTCLGAGHAMLSRGHVFDVCLVDESTQVSQPSVLRPLFSARRFVLIGDPHQLPPVIRSLQAKKLGLSESLFSRLESPNSTVTLSLNYRMNRVITELANQLTYAGELTCGSTEVAEATLCISHPLACSTSWLSKSLSPKIEDSVLFLDTSCVPSQKIPGTVDFAEESACSNIFEVQLIELLISALLERGVKGGDIGVIAPYRAQVALLAEAIANAPNSSGINVNTVDQFQGQDKQVILYSCTRSDGESHHSPKENEILNDQRRLTVAITRAKVKLILVGHSVTLKLYAPFKKLLASISPSNVVPVND